MIFSTRTKYKRRQPNPIPMRDINQENSKIISMNLILIINKLKPWARIIPSQKSLTRKLAFRDPSALGKLNILQ